MSGLIGKLSYDLGEPLARPILEQMLDAITHRRHESRAIHTAPGIALGAWSTEPGAAGGGIGANEDDTIRAVADAALTNARDLRRTLERSGHVFKTQTGAELIAHAYEEWDERAVERLEGPFACAVWDARRHRLLLARDHVGIRRLYFALLHGHGIAFASEARALLHDPGVGREYNPAAIDAYLSLGYVPAPLTAYRRISKLEPAQRMTVEGRRLQVDTFWDLPHPQACSTVDVVEALSEGLRRAAQACSPAGAATAALFSGGPASAALVTESSRDVSTVVTVAVDQTTSTISGAAALARALGTQPRIEVSTPDACSAARFLSAQMDEPLADPALLIQYAVCEAARAHADAALTGHGARVFWMPSERCTLGEGNCETAHAAATPHAVWVEAERHGLYTRRFSATVRESDPLARTRELFASRITGDEAERAQYVAARTVIPESTLTIADWAGNAAGLPLYFPFLDRDLVSLAARVPAALKSAHAPDALLHAIVAGRVATPWNGQAQAPDVRWLQNALAILVPRLLLAERFDGRAIVSRVAIERLWDEHRTGRRDHRGRLWSLVMLELWLREWIDDHAEEEPLEYALMKVA